MQKKERELYNIQEVSERWLAKLKANVIRAQELGLLESHDIADPSKDQMVAWLNDVVVSYNVSNEIKRPLIRESIDKLDEIERLESEVSAELTTLRRRMQEIKRLESTTRESLDAHTRQSNRLKISSWFSESFQLNGRCPICSNILDSERETLIFLTDSLKKIEKNSDCRKDVTLTLDLEESRISAEIGKHTEVLEGLRIQRNDLVANSHKMQRKQYKIESIQRFIGNIENALLLYNKLGKDEKLHLEVETLKQEVKELN